MSVFARLRTRRVAIVAAAAAIAVSASTLTQLSVASDSASAIGSNFLCDNNTLYGITAAGHILQVNATTGETQDVATLPTATNALGITKNGTQAWAFKSGGNSIDMYNPVTGASTTIANPEATNTTEIRGAVDPVNNIYYYAGAGPTARLAAYDIGTSTELGQVANISGLSNSNGDMAFGTDGTLYVVDGAAVYRVDNVPSTAGTTTLAAVNIANLPTGTNSPGIAYSTDGYLYVAAGNTNPAIYRIDPSAGATTNTPANTVTMSTAGVTNTTGVIDLATCNYANSLRGQVNIINKAAAGDEFTVTNTGGGISKANVGTTSGNTLGLQTDAASISGPNLVVGGASYTVTQTGAGTTTLSNYSVGWTCTNKTTGAKFSGNGNVATFTYPAATTSDGSDVVCVFTDALMPVANPDTNITPVNSPISSTTTTNLLKNDTGSSIKVTTTGVQATPHGSVTVASDGSYTYTPNTDYSGTDTFPYTISDVNGTTVSSTATITITPKAVNDSISTGVNTPAVISTLTANDHGSSLKVTSVPATTAHGTVSVDASGVVTYTPATNYVGSDSFVYTATDAANQTTTATVTVTIAPSAVDDSAATKANTPVTTPVLTANDHANSAVTQTITQPAHGTAQLNPDGTVLYTPATDYSGPDSFTYTAKDSSNATYDGNVTITVTPLAVNDAATTPANTQVISGNLATNDHGSAPLKVTSITQPGASFGAATLNADNTVTFVPASGFSGKVTIPYVVTDPSNGTGTANLVVTVTPTGLDDAGTTPVNTTLTVPSTIGVLANDQGSLSVTSNTNPSHGSVTANANGAYTYVPTAEYSGPDQFTYTAKDADGGTVTQTVRLTVTPKANNDTNTTPANTLVNSTVLSNDHGSTLNVTGLGAVTNGTATIKPDNTIDFTPANDFSGTATVPYTVTDAANQTANATLTITVTPKGTDDAATTGIDIPLSLPNLTANDHGSGLKVTSVPATSAHGTVSVNGAGVVTYTPNTGYFGSDSFVYTATDSSNQTETATVNITISPAAVNDTATTNANSPVTTANLTANDHASNGVIQSITQPTNGTAVWNTAAGTVTYTPNPDFSGTDTFQYTAKDDSGATYTGTVTITVKPVAVNDPETTPAETPVNVTPTANDHGSAPLTVTGITQPTTGGSAALNPDGTVTVTPAADFSGTITVPYTITDPSNQTATANIVVTVTPTGADDAGITPVNTTLTVNAANGVLANDKGSLSVSAHTAPSHGTLTIANDGSYVYTPTAEYSGLDQFQYTATDGTNSVTQLVKLTVTPTAANDNASTSVDQPINVAVRSNDHGSALTITNIGAVTNGSAVVGAGNTIDFTPTAGFSGTATVPYTVTDSANQSVSATLTVVVDPTAADDTTSTAVDTPVSIPESLLIANDEGTGLHVTGVFSAPVNGGTATYNAADHSITFTPKAGASGVDSFEYTVTDSSNHSTTAVVTVTIGNVATPDTGTTPANTTLTVNAANGVLANDLGTKPMTATILTQPTHGTVNLQSDGSYTYQPTTGFSGTDTFQYTAKDASGNTATGTVTITVTPTAANDTATVNAGSTLTVTAPGVLGNDAGSTLTVTVKTPPANGTLALNSNGSYTYTPATGFSGTESFTYTAKDSSGQTVDATVTVTVKPTAPAADPTTTAGTPVTVDAANGLLKGATGSGLTASLKTPPTHGTVTVNPDGSYTYTPNAGFTGDDTFVFTVTDSSGQKTDGTATVTVEPLASAKNDSVTATSDQPITLDPLTNDSATGGQVFDTSTLRLIDPTSNTPVLQVVVPNQGTWTVQGGKLQFAPVAGFVGIASVKYQVTDTSGATVSATDTVTYPAVATLAHTGTDAAQFDGSLIAGLLALFMGLVLLLVERERRGRRRPRHSTAI